jgi:hypothetical protein
MPFEPKEPEPEPSISAAEEELEKGGEEDFAVGPEGGEHAAAHTVKGGTIG